MKKLSNNELRDAVDKYNTTLKDSIINHNKFKNRTKVNNSTRAFVYNRDNYECVICKSKDNLTIDHIIPRIRGGTFVPENLQTLCIICNKIKGRF